MHIPSMSDWETAPAVTETPDIKLFGKWSTDDVQINDISLQVPGWGVCVYNSSRGIPNAGNPFGIQSPPLFPL